MTSPSFIRQELFWDIVLNELDLEQHKGQVISRVVMRGTWDDFKVLISFYGKEKVIAELLKTRFLDDLTLNFCSFYFQQPLNDFRCYQLKPFTPQHFSY